MSTSTKRLVESTDETPVDLAWLEKIGCEMQPVCDLTEASLFQDDQLLMNWEIDATGNIIEVAICGEYGKFRMHTRGQVRLLGYLLGLDIK